MKRIFKVNQLVMYGFGIILVIMILIAFFSWRSSIDSTDGMAWEEHTYHVKLALAEIKKTMLDAETGQRGYLYTGKEEYLKPYNTAKDSIEEKINGLAKEVSDNPVQVERVKKVRSLIEEKFKELGEVIVLKQAGKEQDAVNLVLSNRGRLTMDELRVKFDEIDKVEDDLLVIRDKAVHDSIRLGTYISFGGTLLSILIGIFIARFIAMSIIKPLADAAANISTTSTEISSTVEQHERTATGQAASVTETTTTIDELGASSRQSAEQADSVAAIAKGAQATTEEGVRMARGTSDGMVKMKEKMEGIGVQILHLSDQTGQIGKIATAVTDISGQINMLALNAAVEAVRAGEQGKGFAVIAQEIRKLADQGKKSAEQANTIVADIQKATNSAVMVTEEGTKTVQEVAEIATRTGESFASISGVVSSVYENAQQVSLNQKQQNTAIKQVTEAMNQINVGAKETAAGISQTKIGIQRLNEAAQGLKKMV